MKFVEGSQNLRVRLRIIQVLVLVLLGVMDLAWMGVVASLIFAEKVLPFGALLSRVSGIALIAAGVVLATGLTFT